MPVIEATARTGHIVAACASASTGSGRWHWTYGNGRTLCGVAAGTIFEEYVKPKLSKDLECGRCSGKVFDASP